MEIRTRLLIGIISFITTVLSVEVVGLMFRGLVNA